MACYISFSSSKLQNAYSATIYAVLHFEDLNNLMIIVKFHDATCLQLDLSDSFNFFLFGKS